MIDFSVGLYKDVSKLYMKRPKGTILWTTFWEVFDDHFWIVFGGVFLIQSLQLFFALKFGQDDPQINYVTALASVVLSTGTLDMHVKAKKVPGRTMIFTIAITGAVAYWSYNAGLISTLTIEMIVFPIKTFEDLKANSNYKVLIFKGTYLKSLFSYIGTLNFLTTAFNDRFGKHGIFQRRIQK